MNTTTISSSGQPHRKLIDIPEETFRVLSLKATSLGLNLKKYIEQILVDEANEMDDAEIYRALAASRPDGHAMLDPQSKDAFMRRHGIGHNQ